MLFSRVGGASGAGFDVFSRSFLRDFLLGFGVEGGVGLNEELELNSENTVNTYSLHSDASCG